MEERCIGAERVVVVDPVVAPGMVEEVVVVVTVVEMKWLGLTCLEGGELGRDGGWWSIVGYVIWKGGGVWSVNARVKSDSNQIEWKGEVVPDGFCDQ